VFNVYDHSLPTQGGDGPEALLPCLVCFINGHAAIEWSGRDAAERKRAVLEQLARWFGPKARRPTAFVEKDWVHDEWSGGCPIAMFPTNVWSTVGGELRTPCGRIHWAGTETAEKNQGFIDGGIQAGRRAASEVLVRLAENGLGGKRVQLPPQRPYRSCSVALWSLLAVLVALLVIAFV